MTTIIERLKAKVKDLIKSQEQATIKCQHWTPKSNPKVKLGSSYNLSFNNANMIHFMVNIYDSTFLSNLHFHILLKIYDFILFSNFMHVIFLIKTYTILRTLPYGRASSSYSPMVGPHPFLRMVIPILLLNSRVSSII